MEVNVSQKPGEATPRMVKNVFLVACVQYFLAGIIVLAGLLFGQFAFAVKVALLLTARGDLRKRNLKYVSLYSKWHYESRYF